MAVAFDAVGPSAAGATQSTSTPQSTPLTWSHTCTGESRLLVVGVAVGVPGPSSDSTFVVAVTYNSTPMTSLAKVHSNNSTTGFIELFYLVAPSAGANTVSVSITANAGLGFTLSAGSVSFTGVDQSTPLVNTATNIGSGTTPTVNVTSAVDSMVVDAVCAGSAIGSSNQTSRWIRNTAISSAAGNGAQSTAAGAATVTMSYSITSDFWGIIGAKVNAVSDDVITEDLTSGLGLVIG